MTFPTAINWEVRPTNGVDTNGGGFSPGESAKDVTAATDLTIDASNNLKVTSSTHSFVSGDVGKYLRVTRTGNITTLGASIANSSVTTATVASGANIANGDYIMVDTETIQVTGGGGTTSLTIVRGAFGTAASSHSNGALVSNTRFMTRPPYWNGANAPNADFVSWHKITGISGSAALLHRSPAAAGQTGTMTYDLYSGIDYSQQNAAQVNIDNSTITCTTTGANSNTLTFTGGYTAVATDVGNLVQFASGTNINTGIGMITGFTSSTWTIAMSTGNLTNGTGAGSAVVAKMGGAVKTLTKPVNFMTTVHHTVYVKAEATISSTASNTLAVGDWIGYTSSRNDAGKVTVQLSTNTGLTGLTSGGNGSSRLENFTVDCNSLGTSTGISIVGQNWITRNCEVKNFTKNGIILSNTGANVYNCEVHGGTSAATAAINGANLGSNPDIIAGNYVHDNACSGITSSNPGNQIMFNIVDNNSGSTSDGIVTSSSGQSQSVMFNTVNRSGRHGVNCGSSAAYSVMVKGNIIANSGGSTGTNAAVAYGIIGDTGGSPQLSLYGVDGNAFYNNLTDNRSGMDDLGASGTGTSYRSEVPYVNSADVSLTASPFNNVGGQDYGLNSTAGGGAACKNITGAFTFPGASSVGYYTYGAVPPAPAAAASTVGHAYCQ